MRNTLQVNWYTKRGVLAGLYGATGQLKPWRYDKLQIIYLNNILIGCSGGEALWAKGIFVMAAMLF